MATIFDLLNALNNNNSNLYSSLSADGGECKRQQQQHNPLKQTISNKQQQQPELKVISVIPEMDVTMYDDKLVIDVELSGVSKDNIEIDIKDSILAIQGEKKKKSNASTTTTTNISTTGTTTKNDSDGPSIEEFEDAENKEHKPKSTATNNSNETKPSSSPSPNNTGSSSSGKKYISERSFGYFKRFIDLSKIIYQLDLTSITTKFENGLLTIQINKKSNHKSNSFKISIN